MLQKLHAEEKVIVGGDMRADSPGHSAKFGSYTMMDLKNNKVVDLQLVQSNEVGGSYHMELEGLKRSLELLKERGVTLDCIVTDRHLQIQKFLRESSITQFFDVWHIEKGISKQLEKAAKKKDCEKLRGWVKSIRNHIYWTAATSTTGPERVAKWTSILNHVQDIHSHDDPLFPKCLHPLRIAQYQWMAAGMLFINHITLLLYKYLNAGLSQAGDNSLNQEDFESCGQTQPTPPDFIFGVIPCRHPALCSKECCVSISWNVVQTVPGSPALQ
ncbi:uncharacterized protein LOC117547417 isoform X1 [Gymnodraco acuticeps]|uniref:Uncharacterized protein LOC117547417 isoform X1 n=1 Tax=Gymnodraco acuticeps TaxID=8218 RepID=A0A6P8VAM0_GYMAC|nr:uncharacterized protein LOC117547417 isoform X1 [Gymnodraco acuticeps]